MSSVNNRASTSIDKYVGIGNNKKDMKNHDTTMSEEYTTENGKGNLPSPFLLASEHDSIQGGMYNGGNPPPLQIKEGTHDGEKSLSAFVTPGKGNGKDKERRLDPEIDDFYAALTDAAGKELLEETNEERKEREAKEDGEKEEKNKNKNLIIDEKSNKNKDSNVNEVERVTKKKKTTAVYMTYHEFKKWDLENNIPGLVNQFWMSHPKVIWTGMCFWLHYNIDIAVPYKWNAVDFTCPYTNPPATSNKNEKYKEMSMIQVIEKCEEFIKSPIPNSRNTSSFKEYQVKYPPKVVKLRKKVASLLKQIERMDTNIVSGERHLKTLRNDGANDEC